MEEPRVVWSAMMGSARTQRLNWFCFLSAKYPHVLDFTSSVMFHTCCWHCCHQCKGSRQFALLMVVVVVVVVVAAAE